MEQSDVEKLYVYIFIWHRPWLMKSLLSSVMEKVEGERDLFYNGLLFSSNEEIENNFCLQ